MEAIIQYTIYFHAFCGGIALISGIIPIVSKKGGQLHIKSGKVFFVAMLLVSATALVVSIFKSHEFLLLIGLFALYQTVSGYRAVGNKLIIPQLLDWLNVVMGIVTGIFMLISGNIVLLVFGIICALLSLNEITLYYRSSKGKPVPKKEWLRTHIGMMVGSYIATSTAFLVVNVTFVNPAWLPWIIPTIIGTPIIIFMSRKFAPRRKVA